MKLNGSDVAWYDGSAAAPCTYIVHLTPSQPEEKHKLAHLLPLLGTFACWGLEITNQLSDGGRPRTPSTEPEERQEVMMDSAHEAQRLRGNIRSDQPGGRSEPGLHGPAAGLALTSTDGRWRIQITAGRRGLGLQRHRRLVTCLNEQIEMETTCRIRPHLIWDWRSRLVGWRVSAWSVVPTQMY